MKINKNFQPIHCDAGDEFFPNGIFEFNITKLSTFIKNNLEKFQIEEFEVQSVRSFHKQNLNESTIQDANYSIPVILAEISPGQFNVIDGNHRLEKAYRDGMNKILAYRILAEQHIRFLTSFNAYQAYVHYWNSKIASLKDWRCHQKNRVI